ncbi:MAG TPA: hypothetical protein VKU01_17630 [Bryobacteraceae bacterium]|nr:hypothetical protein [Bryobacteraceae bacterium]
MQLRKQIALMVTWGALSGAVWAQTPTTPPPTCTTAPTTITNFSIERVLTLANILTTQTPNIPPAILQAITSGAMEIRERLIYNPQANTLTSTVFLVAPGSPNPTPISTDVTSSTILSYVFTVDRIYSSCKPTPSIMFVGTLSSVSAGSPFGNASGAPVAVSVGYTTDNPPKVNNVVALIAGQVVYYAAAANGTITFPAAPVTPPGSTGGPSPVITGGQPLGPLSSDPTHPTQIFQNGLQLDSSGSSNPSGTALTYMWSAVVPGTTTAKSADFLPGTNSASPNIQFTGGRGVYQIILTITDAKGGTGSTSVYIDYEGGTH